MRTIAEQYRKLGLHVLPTQQDKSPANSVKWLEDVPLDKFDHTYGIGIVCGSLSDGLECLDFDNHFGDARKILDEFFNIEEVKEILHDKKLVIEKTVSGGFHVLFKSDFCENNQKLAQRGKYNAISKKEKPDTLIETRGNNGYFVCAPTPGYEFFIQDFCSLTKISELERDILISAAKSFNEWYVEEKSIETSFYNEGLRVGDKYNEDVESIQEARILLEAYGWKFRSYFGTRPGKNKGISATYGKVAPGVFYVFSSNAFPFEPNKGYRPFQILSFLKFNGDFKETAKYLAQRYGIDKKEIPSVPAIKNNVSHLENNINHLDEFLFKAKIDPNKQEERPPVVLSVIEKIATQTIDIPIFTLGNISLIQGFQKSKKTYFVSKLLAGLVATDNSRKIKGSLPFNKKKVVLFDTEQSRYHAQKVSKRIKYLTGGIDIEMFAFREFEPKVRRSLIERYIILNKDLGFVMIDGIVDLITDFNNLEQSQELVGWLMKISALYNLHICMVIHQNKATSNARGHLGALLSQKSETVIEIEKIDNSTSMVKGKDTRNRSFEDFQLYIDGNGNPHFQETEAKSYQNPMQL